MNVLLVIWNALRKPVELRGTDSGALYVAPLPRTDPTTYLAAQQLPAAGALTNPQTTPFVVPSWATYVVAYCTYTQGIGGTGAGSASGVIYLGSSSTSPLLPLDLGDGNGPHSVVMGNVCVPIPEAQAGARIGFELHEVGDQPHPGKVSIEFVAR